MISENLFHLCTSECVASVVRGELIRMCVHMGTLSNSVSVCVCVCTCLHACVHVCLFVVEDS